MSDHRFNALTGEYNPETITDEQHTVAFDSAINAYAVRLINSVQQTSPSSITVVEDGTGTPFTEQTARTAPNAGQFWVDYEASGFYGTGVLYFNASDNGTVVNVSYKSLGEVTSKANISASLVGGTIAGDLTVSGNLSFTPNPTTWPALSVAMSANLNMATGALATIPFDTVIFDTGGYYNNTTYQYTPLSAGYYRFSVYCWVNRSILPNPFYIGIHKNGSYYHNTGLYIASLTTVGFSCTIQMNGTTDYIESKVSFTGAGTGTVFYGGAGTGYLSLMSCERIA